MPHGVILIILECLISKTIDLVCHLIKLGLDKHSETGYTTVMELSTYQRMQVQQYGACDLKVVESNGIRCDISYWPGVLPEFMVRIYEGEGNTLLATGQEQWCESLSEAEDFANDILSKR